MGQGPPRTESPKHSVGYTQAAGSPWSGSASLLRSAVSPLEALKGGLLSPAGPSSPSAGAWPFSFPAGPQPLGRVSEFHLDLGFSWNRKSHPEEHLKVCCLPNLCELLILDSEWLRGHGAV